MANEAVIIELLGEGASKGYPITFNVANGTAITKGTLLSGTDLRGAIACAATSTLNNFVGIAAMDKVASDGSTTITAYTKGIFDLTISELAGITNGAYVAVSGSNTIKAALEADFPAGNVVGKALEAGSDAEVIEVAVGVFN